MRLRSTKTLAFLAVLALATPLQAAFAQTVSMIRFARGNDNASVMGTVTGRQYRDYKLTVGAGQNLGVSLITKGNAYFNILPPGSKDVAVYNSSIAGQDATGIRTKAGTYTIRVYLMGGATASARPVNFQLSVSVM